MITEYCQLLSACTRLLDGETSVVVNPITRRKTKINLLPFETIYFDEKTKKFHHDIKNKRDEYLLSHANNPDTLWLLESSKHWVYLRKLAIALYGEYKFRYNKDHAAGELALKLKISQKLKDNGFRPPPLCMPLECKMYDRTKELTVKSYRKYYNLHKRHIASWRNRCVPDWYINE